MKQYFYFWPFNLQLGRDIVQIVESVRFKYHIHDGDIRNLPVLIDDNKVNELVFGQSLWYFSASYHSLSENSYLIACFNIVI